MRKKNRFTIQLGTNIGNRIHNLEIAIRKINDKIGAIQFSSGLYETEAWGNENQAKFVNQIIVVETLLSEIDLLRECQKIENSLGPKKRTRWGARIMDLDILFFEDKIHESTHLQIPHPRIHERKFVLQPLNELMPDFIHPSFGKTINNLLSGLDDTLDVKKISDQTIKKTIKYQFIAIEGNIGAGKTTFSQMLSDKLDTKLILEEFSDNPFLPYFYKDSERFGFPVELFFMTERHKQLQNNLLQQSMFTQGVVADYFFLKTLLFAGNNLAKEEMRLFQRLFNILNASFPNPEILLYIHRPVEVLLKQIKERGRDFEKDISLDYLTNIQNTYLDYFQTVTDFPVVLIELDDIDFKDDPFVFEEIVNILRLDFENGFHKISINKPL